MSEKEKLDEFKELQSSFEEEARRLINTEVKDLKCLVSRYTWNAISPDELDIENFAKQVDGAVDKIKDLLPDPLFKKY